MTKESKAEQDESHAQVFVKDTCKFRNGLKALEQVNYCSSPKRRQRELCNMLPRTPHTVVEH